MLVRTCLQFPTFITTRLQLLLCRNLCLPEDLLQNKDRMGKELHYFEMARAIISKVDTLLPILDTFFCMQFYKAKMDDVIC